MIEIKPLKSANNEIEYHKTLFPLLCSGSECYGVLWITEGFKYMIPQSGPNQNLPIRVNGYLTDTMNELEEHFKHGEIRVFRFDNPKKLYEWMATD